MHDLVTIVVLILPFVFVIAITWLNINEKQKRRQLQADLYAKALEKGQSLPSDLFTEDKKERNPLNTGITLTAISIGIIVFLWGLIKIMAQNTPEYESFSGIALVGFVPLMAGIAHLIIHFIEKKKEANKNAK